LIFAYSRNMSLLPFSSSVSNAHSEPTHQLHVQIYFQTFRTDIAMCARVCVRERARYVAFSVLNQKILSANLEKERGGKARASDARARTTSSFNALLMPACLPLKFWKTSSGVRGLNSLIGLLVQIFSPLRGNLPKI